MHSLDRFDTERLCAAKFSADDLDDLCRMHQDPVVMATLGGVRTDAVTARFLQEKLAHWARHGFGYWMFRERETGQFVGRGGIQHINVGGNQEIEVGYSVLTTYWGRGLATEMAAALVAVGFEQVNLPEIVSFTLTTNVASERVMQKTGFTYERTIIHENEPHVLYRLTREQHATSVRPQSTYRLVAP